MADRRPRKEAEPTVFVVDDDPAVCDSLRFLFESVGLRTVCHASPTPFLERFESDGPGCLVLDVRMPRMGGLDLLAALRRRGCELPVVFITGHASVPLAVRAMEAGATHFLEKPVDDEVLVSQVQRAIARDARRRARETRRRRALENYATLTPREREVLDLVVAGQPNKAIAARLGLSEKTVESHRAHLMKKMGADSLAALVAAAIRWDLTGKPVDDPGKS